MTEFQGAKVLDHGFVYLESVMATDLQVVNSARVSFGKRSNYIQVGHEEGHAVMGLADSDAGLINFLLKNRHGTPFEHNSFIFHVKAPIFIFREWQRHRIGSFNEMSARYMELPGEWYIPEPENVRVRVGKPGHYKYEAAPIDDAMEFIAVLDNDCQEGYRKYKWALDKGIAPELARGFLHVFHYSEMFWTVNARSMMNFLSLRNEEHAQWEIRQFAIEVEKYFARQMPATHAAFEANGRVAP